MRCVPMASLLLATPVAACMTPDPVVVRPKEPIGAAIRRMEEGGYRHLPASWDEDGRARACCRSSRIVHYLAEHFPATVCNQPPDPASFPTEAEGA